MPFTRHQCRGHIAFDSDQGVFALTPHHYACLNLANAATPGILVVEGEQGHQRWGAVNGRGSVDDIDQVDTKTLVWEHLSLRDGVCPEGRTRLTSGCSTSTDP